MSLLFDSTFTLIEWLALTGFAQSLLIVVYIVFRVKSWKQVSLSLAYFLALGLAFALQFSLRLNDYEQAIRLAMWLCWALSPALCYLLVLQIARGVALPGGRQFWVLAQVPLAFLAWPLTRDGLWLYWVASIFGGVTMLALWGHKNLFAALRKSKGGRERYWLVMMLVAANVAMVAVNSLRSTRGLGAEDADALLIVLGIAFIYLASSALFRVYPSPVQLNDKPTRFKLKILTEEEKKIAERVKKLMEVDKLYHEPTFSRADLAREINISENILSRVINVAFGKSFPKLLNEFRVEDAKRMLRDPEIAVQVVAFEVGFNSLASFNRAFREVTGETPSGYRQSIR